MGCELSLDGVAIMFYVITAVVLTWMVWYEIKCRKEQKARDIAFKKMMEERDADFKKLILSLREKREGRVGI